MYRHKLKLSSGEFVEWTNDNERVLPNYYGDTSGLVFFYEVFNPLTDERWIIPLNQVLCIHTTKIGG